MENFTFFSDRDAKININSYPKGSYLKLYILVEPHFFCIVYYTKHLENVLLRICGFYWYIWGFLGWAVGEGCQPFESVVPVKPTYEMLRVF